MKSRLVRATMVSLAAASLLMTGCGGGGGSSQGTASTGILSGTVDPTGTAGSIRAQGRNLGGLEVLLRYYDDNNILQNIPSVGVTTTDSTGKFTFRNIPTSFANMIIRVNLANGQTMDGFVPAIEPGGETQAPEINQTIASLALILEYAAQYRTDSGLSGRYHINMGEIMSMIRPSYLVQLNANQIRELVKVFIDRERIIRDSMDSGDAAAYESAAYEAARELCEAMAKKGSDNLGDLDNACEEYGGEIRKEIRNLPPKAVLILQQANGLVGALPDKMPADLQDEIAEDIQTRLEQDSHINNMHAIVHALRILSRGLTYTQPATIDSTESSVETLAGTFDKASNGVGIGRMFAGGIVPDEIFAQVQALFEALGLFAGNPSLLNQILADIPEPGTQAAPDQIAATRGQAMKKARENLDAVLAAHPALAGKIDSEAKKQAMIFLLFGPGDIGIPMPWKPGQNSISAEPRTYFGVVQNATESYAIGTYTYEYIILPAAGYPPAPASWGHLVYVRPGENLDLAPFVAQTVEAFVNIEQPGQSDRAPAGIVTNIQAVQTEPSQ